MNVTSLFKDKLNEALTLIPTMTRDNKIEAIDYWNKTALRFQNLVDDKPSSSPDGGERLSTSHQNSHQNQDDMDYYESLTMNDNDKESIVEREVPFWEKPPEVYNCKECGKSGFSTKGNLKRHLKTHSGEKPFECQICPTRFTEKKSLKIHVRKHTGEKPYKCKVCDKEFSQAGVLKTHEDTHSERKDFKCHQCPRAFRQRSQLNLHLKRHNGVKSLACSQCSAKFITKGDLDRHFRIHTGERPYVCCKCGDKFTRQQSLNDHLNRHSGRKPHVCNNCSKQFSEKAALSKSYPEYSTNEPLTTLESIHRQTAHESSFGRGIKRKDREKLRNYSDLVDLIPQSSTKEETNHQ